MDAVSFHARIATRRRAAPCARWHVGQGIAYALNALLPGMGWTDCGLVRGGLGTAAAGGIDLAAAQRDELRQLGHARLHPWHAPPERSTGDLRLHRLDAAAHATGTV